MLLPSSAESPRASDSSSIKISSQHSSIDLLIISSMDDVGDDLSSAEELEEDQEESLSSIIDKIVEVTFLVLVDHLQHHRRYA